MAELVEIEKIEIEIGRGDDVSMPFTSTITLTGYTFVGTIKSVNTGITLTGGTLSISVTGTDGMTVVLTSAQTTAMTEDLYYAYIQWTDTNTKKKTFLKLIFKMVN
jgi:hypothetical protein